MCEKAGWTRAQLSANIAGFVMTKSNDHQKMRGVVMGRRTCYGVGGHLELCGNIVMSKVGSVGTVREEVTLTQHSRGR